jgi:aminopeptidase YwaD
MDERITNERVKRHFEAICDIGERPVGSEGGRKAEAYVEETLKAAGFETRRDEFPCVDWKAGPCALENGDRGLVAIADPYSPPVRTEGPALPVSSLEELAASRIGGGIVVLGPGLCGFPIMPKAFDFYNPEEHRRLVALLEEGRPAAVVAVSPHAEGVWPVFADPDLAIASVTIPSIEKDFVAAGSELRLSLDASSRPSKAATVSGLLSGNASGAKRRLFCAHLDTKHYSPGALDNGGSVAALLALAELLSAKARGAGAAMPDIELAFFMGEECNAYGEKAWLAARGGSVSDLGFAMNCDGAGGKGEATALSFFNFDAGAEASVLESARELGRFARAEPWYESDHYLFWPAGIPTIAATSGDAHRFDRLIHGPRDRAELVETGLLAELAELAARLALSDIGT